MVLNNGEPYSVEFHAYAVNVSWVSEDDVSCMAINDSILFTGKDRFSVHLFGQASQFKALHKGLTKF